MKNLITTAASLLLLLLFVVQFAGNQVVHNRLFQADMAIDTFRDAAKEQGCITAENKEALVLALEKICDCEAGQIQVSGTQALQERGKMISYSVRFPLKDLVAAGAFLGIGPEENMAWFEDSGWVVSRYELTEQELENEKSDNYSGNHASDGDGNSL
jgi:hypothetical protein